jgi:uncharacterized protein YndB with AHSA1/START domain
MSSIDRYLRMTRRFEVPPEKVFDAWTDPAWTKQWLFTSPTSQNDTKLDLRVGGKWRIADIRDGVTYVANGEYLEVDRPNKLVFTFSMPQFSPNSDTITVELVADGAGCVMTFTQSGIDIAKEIAATPEGEMGGSEHGWTLMFLGLKDLVETGKVNWPPEMLPKD